MEHQRSGRLGVAEGRRFAPTSRIFAIVLAALLALALAAAVAVSSKPQPAGAAEGGSVARCGGGTILLNAKEKETFERHNDIRRDRGLRQFCVHPRLQEAARGHSRDMVLNDYFSHDTKRNGERYDQRLKRFGYKTSGYRYYSTGENIAYGMGLSGEPAQIMDSWMNSDGHRRNILNSKFREVGIGVYTGTYSTGGRSYDETSMYTLDFGVRLK